MDFLTDQLLDWYAQNQRNLPWRNTKNPYFIWLSEVILQQTRVVQGWNYYLRFTKNYPTLADLALAEESSVLKDWQGLGYYSRARNLHTAAKWVYFENKNIFPPDFKTILQLKGVGNYTAAAIASIAFNEKIAAIDGNVYRVLSRFYADPTPIDSTKGAKVFFNYAMNAICAKQPGNFNQAMMELGACICHVKKPQCALCPLQQKCAAYSQNKIAHFPVKSKKIKVINRFFHFFILEDQDHIILTQRKEKDIWQGLFVFPYIEALHQPNYPTLNFSTYLHQAIQKEKPIYQKHLLTHQKLTLTFEKYFFKTLPTTSLLQGWLIVAKKEIQEYAVPKPIAVFLETY